MGNEDAEKSIVAEDKQSGVQVLETSLQAEEEEKSSSEDDSSDYTDSDEDVLDEEKEAVGAPEVDKEDNFKEAFQKIVERRAQEEKEAEKELWNFPPDKEQWTEEDLEEHWEDYWGDTRAVGWDPNFVSQRSWEKYEKLWKEGKPGPPGTPYYVPYRKFYPPIPDNHFDIQTPEDVVEELDRIEEFLLWYSYLFKNGSSYEGTVFDDLAHGKGVYTTAFDLVRYEGDWFQNMMQGHGVIEADILEDEPIPDTEEAAEAKAEGQLLSSDYMDPFDREWLKMDAEEQFQQHGRDFTPWEENAGWIEKYGTLPEKGHYKYAGQWKHSRFHGCGVYEVNGRTIWGKFYFGELLPDPDECTIDFSALHAGLAEVAAAKARMFANKPDGMVRQVKGPFTDPSHPYMYEEEDLWMAPGFINAYYEVPKEWKVYVEEVDKEQEMWLNSFYKAPFVVPMPPELEYLWSQEDEFVLLEYGPSAMDDLNPENIEMAPDDLQGEALLHVPSGTIINWYTDQEGHLRFFIQPITENGEVIPEAAIPLPTGFDEALKEEEYDEELEKSKKKNFFLKLKEAWNRTSEDYKKDRQKRREELEKKWKQDDQIREYRRKLKKAERNLAYQIKVEQIRAKKMRKSSLQKESENVPESVQEQPEQDEETKSTEADAKETEEEEVSRKSEHMATQANQEDMQDDTEDDKKPKSFGKVAMLVTEDTHGRRMKKKHEVQQQGFMSPTAFASLTLGLKIDGCEMLKAKINSVATNLFYRWRKPCIQQPSSDSLSGCFSGRLAGSVNVRSHMSNSNGLRMLRSFQKPARTASHCRPWYISRGKRFGYGQVSGKYNRTPRRAFKTVDVMRPTHEILSLALPLEPFIFS